MPFNRKKPHLCFATRIVDYLDQLKQSHPDLGPDDVLFRRALKKGFGKQVFGRNMLAQVGVDLAKAIGMFKNT